MKILVVEDDARAAGYLRRGLSEESYVVDVCANGQDGLDQLLTNQYDLMILDIMLPVMDGWMVLREMNQAKVSTPVLVLTARDAVRDRIHGLSLGADDYLVKPFAIGELLARVRALLRRKGSQPAESILHYEDLSLDPARMAVRRGVQDLDLTPREFCLLELFMRHEGEVLSRTYIAEQVWDMRFDSDSNVIDVNVRRLRAKLDDPFDRKLIHTIRGRGYVLR